MRKLLLLVLCLVLVSVVWLGVGCGTTEPQEGTVLEGSENGGSTTEGMTQEQLVQLIQQTVGDMNLKGDKGDTGAQGLQGVQGPAGVQGPVGDPAQITVEKVDFKTGPTWLNMSIAYRANLQAGDLVIGDVISHDPHGQCGLYFTNKQRIVTEEEAASPNWESLPGTVILERSISAANIDTSIGYTQVCFTFIAPTTSTYMFMVYTEREGSEIEAFVIR